MNFIKESMHFIKEHKLITGCTRIYKNGIISINKNMQLIYLDLISNSTDIITTIDTKQVPFLNVIAIDSENDIFYINLRDKILKINNRNTEIIKKDTNASAVFTYNSDLICFKKNGIFNIKDKEILLKNLENFKLFNFMYCENGDFYIISSKILYIYNIPTNIMTKKNTHYINVNTYDIIDLKNVNVITTQIQTCVCFYGINKNRTRCFMGHFSPKFGEINLVIDYLKKTLGDEYDKMDKKILGGCLDNKTFNYLYDILEDYKFNILEHTLKMYTIIINEHITKIF